MKRAALVAAASVFVALAPALLLPAGALAAPALMTQGRLKQEPYKDLPPDHWGYQATEFSRQQSLTEGFPDGVFRGRQALTRYELCQTAARLVLRVRQITEEWGPRAAESGRKADPAPQPAAHGKSGGPFRDMPAGHWAGAAVRLLSEKEILFGFRDKSFRGSRPATRYELAQTITRLALAVRPADERGWPLNPQGQLKPDPFGDVPPGHWAHDAVEYMRRQGLMEGFPDKSFGGKQPVSRYECVQVLERAMDGLQRLIFRDNQRTVPLPRRQR